MSAAVMTSADAPPYAPAAIETVTAEDFETASIRSAAPSYTSDAPSYHSTVPNPEPVPPYSPPESSITSSTRNSTPAPLISSEPGSRASPGLPPVPSGPLRNPNEPYLDMFRIPTWSVINANPTYHRVALRRAAAVSGPARFEGISRLLGRIEEEEHRNRRPLEDPYLVGEDAAAQARQERLASQARRERLGREHGDEVLIRENRRWDFFLNEQFSRRPRSRRFGLR